jgi:hypothetical protein
MPPAFLSKFPLYAICAFLLASCAGYQIGSPTAQSLRPIHSLFIHPPQNLTTEPSLGIALAHALSQRFDQDGRLKTATENEADVTLRVVLKNASRDPIRADRQNPHRTAQYQSTLQAEISLLDRSGHPLIPPRTLQAKTQYFTQSNLQESERQAWPAAIEELARCIVSYVTESGW